MATLSLPTVQLPTLAGVPEVRFRYFRGVDADIPGMAAANQAARLADGEVEPIDVDDMRSTYSHLERCDPSRDICVIERDGVTVGYARLWWDDLLEGIREYFALCLVAPEIRGLGVESAVLTWTEDRRREIAEGHRAAGDALDRPRWLATVSYDRDDGVAELFARSGWVPNRRFASLVRPDLTAIAEAALPDGLEIRPIVREQALMRRLFEAEVEAFRDHFGARGETAEDYATFLDEPSQDPSLWVVAFDGDEVAGAVRPVIRRGVDGAREGWLDPVYTRRPWRRRGLARALIAESLRRLRDRGADRAALGVDLQNPNQALTLYESCGFRIVSGSTGWRKPLVLEPGDGASPGRSPASSTEAER